MILAKDLAWLIAEHCPWFAEEGRALAAGDADTVLAAFRVAIRERIGRGDFTGISEAMILLDRFLAEGDIEVSDATARIFFTKGEDGQ